MQAALSNALPPLPFAILVFVFALICIAIAGFLIWYALRHSDEVRAKFGRGKMLFEIEAKKRRDAP